MIEGKPNLQLNNKYSVSKMLNQLKDKEVLSLIIIIKNGKTKFEIIGDQKRNKIRPVLKLFSDVAKKYPTINTTCLFSLYDWGTNDDIKELPIFVFTKNIIQNKNIIIPDHLFLRGYNRCARIDPIPYDEVINKYRYKVPFHEKKPIAFMRAGTSKNKILINMFKDIENTDVNWSSKDFIPYEKMFTYKYAIMHYMRWDTVYLILKSDFVTFMYTGYGNYLWYDLFLEDGKDYLSFSTLEEYLQKRKLIENNIEVQKNIMNSSTEKAEKYFTYDFSVNYMGELLLEYQKWIID